MLDLSCRNVIQWIDWHGQRQSGKCEFPAISEDGYCQHCRPMAQRGGVVSLQELGWSRDALAIEAHWRVYNRAGGSMRLAP